ncbi:Cochaperone protein [Elasticomyces elasticus]|nr:Cochaperone protein [Elasticomyces elasticus]KAK3640435.1 Cochaperone protein [Elasticomyces elasticus]KAK4931186.1 Cochaperone protein [Elasticomyces elasticus]KAK5767883.1 Cochaperone protein [Elasticomyces elasticus]
MDAASRGKKALTESNYDDAIVHFTNALKQSPTSPAYLIQRSTAYQRNKQHAEALRDANRAVLEARKRAKREQIVEAQFRRAIALYSLERYGDAEFVFGVVKRMDEKFKGLEMWVNKAKMSVNRLAPEDEVKRACTVGEVPEESEIAEDASATKGNAVPAEKATTGIPAPQQDTSASAPAQTSASTQTPAEKIRHEWYQNNETVYFTLLAKGVPSDKAHIEFTARSLSISFPLSTGSSYDFTLEPLFAGINPEACTARVLSTKIEITLAKTVREVKWKTLESNEPLPTKVDSPTGNAVKVAVLAPAPAPATTAPWYPTSSRNGPKNWDKITEAEDDDDDVEGGDEANHFFKKLFKGATPEAQKAMMKSYTESNGTALSTNWEEVSKGKVETSPPDGMEAKKWS